MSDNCTGRSGEIPIRDYFEMRIEALEKQTALTATQLDRRLSSMNEFRDQLKEQAAGFFTRAEHDLFMKKVEENIQSLRESRAELAGKASQNAVNLALAISVVGAVAGLASILHSLFPKL